ncbi:SH3 domain-containing protein [Streptomyces sp. JJ36]|nr:SH3 domain-containing protein [Streptomyces sp. JJ36]
MTAAGPAMAVQQSAPAAPVKVTVPQQAPQQAPQMGGWHRTYLGKVIARTGLKVRTGPSQRHRVVGFLKHGQIVKIRCKVNGQVINGNPRWYKLANGNWMWASARYIKNIGPAPHFCRH